MADLFSILPNIELTPTDIAEAETFAQKYLEAKYPDLELRQGTAIRDLAIRPAATLIALVNKGIDYHFENNTIAGVTDDSPIDTVDSIMSNLFLSRNEGTLAVVAARLFFSRSKSVTIPAGTTFSTDDVVKFTPTSTYTFSASDMTLDATTGDYFVDIFLQSTGEGIEHNIETGSLLFFTNFDPYFLRGEISYLKEASSPKETNSEFISRADTAISTRNLINNQSIAYKIQSSFTFVSQVRAIGLGHDEMVRDTREILTPSGAAATVHMGGMTDVYCSVPIVKDVEQYTLDSAGKVSIVGAYLDVTPTDTQGGELTNEILANVPYVKNKTGYTSAGELISPEGDNGFSSRQEWVIDYGAFNANKVVSFDVTMFQGIDSIQTYLESTDNRVTCSDIVARAMPVYLLDITLGMYEGVTTTDTIPREIIVSYLRNLSPGETFIMSDLVALLHAEDTIKSLRLPLDISYTLFERGGVNVTGTIIDSLKPESDIFKFELNTLTLEAA